MMRRSRVQMLPKRPLICHFGMNYWYFLPIRSRFCECSMEPTSASSAPSARTGA